MGRIPKELLCGLASLAQGDHSRSSQFFQRSCQFMEPVVWRNTEGLRLRVALAVAYAGLGRKAEAIQQGVLARDERNSEIDAVAGPPIAATVARVYSMLGEKESAVRELEPLISAPFGIGRHQLLRDPAWDTLRGFPAFERLVNAAR